jgi:hypothetical protein
MSLRYLLELGGVAVFAISGVLAGCLNKRMQLAALQL